MTMSKNRRRRLILLGGGFLLGAIGGWLYWRFVGCLGGSCPIWSNPWISTGYGGLLGWLLAGLLPFGQKKKSDDNEPSEKTPDALPKEG